MNLAERIKSRGKVLLEAYPYFVFLLPAFFVIHGMNENFGYVAAEDALRLWMIYSASATLCFGIFYLMYRNRVRAALLTVYLFFVYFFYGVMQDFLAAHANPINRYSIWLPVLLAVFIILLIVMRRTHSKFSSATRYLNLLLSVLIVVDVFGILSQAVMPFRSPSVVDPPAFNNSGKLSVNSPKPDVYLLLFDEYMSSAALKKNMGFDNSDIDSFLVSRNFRIQTASRGNYNFTPFSMSSILNMSYISGLNPKKITGNEYSICLKLLKKSSVMENFIRLGYDVHNYSIFDMNDRPAPIQQEFFPSKTELITNQTLGERLHKHLAWHFVTGRFKIPALADRILYLNYHNNNKLLELVSGTARLKSTRPKFVYSHFIMPHGPYLVDSMGKLRDPARLNDSASESQLYLDNVRYTNRTIKELVSTIQQNSRGQAAIIVMGDHGYRSDSTFTKSEHFKNFNAVYLPPGYPMPYYDSISGVNQFRVLFNSLFDARIPLLKDSTVFLVDQ